MAIENKVVLSVVGDYGNPTGSGLSRIVVDSVRDGADLTSTTAKTIGAALHAALITLQLTVTNVGDIAVTSKIPSYVVKPDDDCNVDRVLVVDFRTKQDSAIRRLTIPGVPTESSSLEKVDSGERLTEDGKISLAAALTTFLDPGEANEIVVVRGKVLQKS